MQQDRPLRTQYFVKRKFTPIFTGENIPELVYASKLPPDAERTYSRIMHAHPDLVEILLISNGSCEFLLGDKKYAIQKGDLLVYNSSVVHDEWAWRENKVDWYCVGIAGLHMPGLRKNALIPEGKTCVFPAGGSFEELRSLFEMIFYSLAMNEPQAELFCHSLTEALLVKVLALASGAETSPVEPPDILGKRIQDYIDAHYTEALTLQNIGDALHISPYYLSHVFKKAIGYSPMQYLSRRRIGEAQTLLLSTKLSVGQISELVGYDTQSYFNLQFTKQVGMAPGRYRQEFAASDDGKEKNQR